MKTSIHPQWHDDCQVTCSCGQKFTTGSTLTEIKVDMCSKCHPFYTGEMRFVDIQGRVERFQAKLKHARSIKATLKAKKVKAQKNTQNLSLKEMLANIKTNQTPSKQ